jgi:hypothetical protein
MSRLCSPTFGGFPNARTDFPRRERCLGICFERPPSRRPSATNLPRDSAISRLYRVVEGAVDVPNAEKPPRDKRWSVGRGNSVPVGGDRRKELRRARYCCGRSRHKTGFEKVTAAIGTRTVTGGASAGNSSLAFAFLANSVDSHAGARRWFRWRHAGPVAGGTRALDWSGLLHKL